MTSDRWTFRNAVKAEVARIGALAQGLRYVTYAIRDPSELDHRRHPDGPRFYVGKSKQMRIRANDHMSEGGRTTSGGSQKDSRIYKIMRKGFVPKFEILDSTPTNLRALISETLWARRSNWLGYRLENRWPEHQGREAPQGLRSVPQVRALEFTVAEALEDGVSAFLECKVCDLYADVDLHRLRPEVQLKLINSLRLQCPGCQRPLFRANLPKELKPLPLPAEDAA